MRTLLAACAIATAFISGAVAQNYPNQTIRIIVPFPPSGSNDVLAREVANGLQDRLKQPVIVENRPGGGGSIAYNYVAKAKPDGYTLMVAPASFTIGPNLVANPTYHPVNDFAAINMMAQVPFVMVVPARVKASSVKEFIALAKSAPKPLSFASSGPGTPHHLSAELFKMNAGLEMVHVPYKGALSVMPDLLAGRVDMFIGAINSLLPPIEQKQRPAPGHCGQQARALAAGLPTMSEVAFKDFIVESPIGLVAPDGTPKDVIERLNREVSDNYLQQGASEPDGEDRRADHRHHRRGICHLPAQRLRQLGQGGQSRGHQAELRREAVAAPQGVPPCPALRE